MAIYTVHVPRTLADPLERADRTTFVRDGFNGWAFVFGPIFLLRHRAWLATVAWIAVVAAGAGIIHLMHLPEATAAGLLFLLALFLGLEGNAIRSDALQRRGYDLADVVAARKRGAGELAFFQAYDARASASQVAASMRRASARSGSGDVIGSFPDQAG